MQLNVFERAQENSDKRSKKIVDAAKQAAVSEKSMFRVAGGEIHPTVGVGLERECGAEDRLGLSNSRGFRSLDRQTRWNIVHSITHYEVD